jgi:hypothetical protein
MKRTARMALVIAGGMISISTSIHAEDVTVHEERGGFETLNGRWLRPDGGYIFEIRAVDPSGKIDALYFNPRPINIAKAEATRDGSKLNVFVELRAPNYPGSTYALVYDPKQDQLRGTYFQAALAQSFEVYFVRMK